MGKITAMLMSGGDPTYREEAQLKTTGCVTLRWGSTKTGQSFVSGPSTNPSVQLINPTIEENPMSEPTSHKSAYRLKSKILIRNPKFRTHFETH